MSKTIAPTHDTVENATTRLDRIRADIDALVEARNTLMLTACAELVAAGVDAHIVTSQAHVNYKNVPHTVGTVGWFSTDYIHGAHQDMRRDEFHIPKQGGEGWEPGPRVFNSTDRLFVARGTYEVLLVDDDNKVLIAPSPNSHDLERAHGHAVSRLRNHAKNELMRVKVRDREITLINPMNTIVHVGDVETAFMWLMGFNETELVAW